MSIFLKPVQRRNPVKPKDPMKWYPVQYTSWWARAKWQK